MERKIALHADPDRCIGCGLCVRDCTAGNISIQAGTAVFADKCYGCGHCIAVCPQGAVLADDPLMADQIIPYDPETFHVPAENLLNFIKFRRSIRQFQDRMPERELLDRIIQAGRYTATASNLQGTGYIIVTEKRKELSQMAVDSLKELGEKTLAAPENVSPLNLGYARSWLTMAEKSARTGDPENFFFHAPVVIIVTAANPIDAGLAAQNMELMANALGLGVIYSGNFIRAYRNAAEIKSFLGIPEGRDAVACLGIGYPAVTYHRTVPRKLPDITWM